MDCVPCNHEGDGGPRMLSKFPERRRRTAPMTITINERNAVSKRGSIMTGAGDLCRSRLLYEHPTEHLSSLCIQGDIAHDTMVLTER